MLYSPGPGDCLIFAPLSRWSHTAAEDLLTVDDIDGLCDPGPGEIFEVAYFSKYVVLYSFPKIDFFELYYLNDELKLSELLNVFLFYRDFKSF